MHFTKQISLVGLAIAFAAATPTAQPNLHVLEARGQNKGEYINPQDPKMSLDEQCLYSLPDGDVATRWNVVIPKADEFTDDTCGSGFLDNLHGRGCAVTGWGCNYADDHKTMNAAFKTQTTCGKTDVSKAINAAFGGKKLVCADYDKQVQCRGDNKDCYIQVSRDDIWG